VNWSEVPQYNYGLPTNAWEKLTGHGCINEDAGSGPSGDAPDESPNPTTSQNPLCIEFTGTVIGPFNYNYSEDNGYNGGY